MILYDYLSSGNGYKVRLLLAMLGLRYERVELDIDAGETRTAGFLAKNPNGKIPALELDDGTVLAESDAILFYLAEGSPYLPSTRLGRARVLQWMFFEQYSHEPYIAVSRYLMQHDVPEEERDRKLAEKRAGGLAALGVLEDRLARARYLVDESFSVADIALYAYTHVAGEGGFDLAPFEAVRAWLARVEAEPGHVPITHVPLPDAPSARA